ncbi:MAG: hypothetical protein HWE11_16295, partial [Gammaproteobacteria bacterium]|nr:hypothetical protein [Gammaproteobacteria bacterium]
MLKQWIFISLMILGLAACAGRPTHYTVDPELRLPESFKTQDKTVLVNVIAPESTGQLGTQRIALAADNNFAESVKKGIVSGLINSGYKISANKHFSDVVMNFNFSELSVEIDPGVVKDELIVTGKLTLTMVKKPTTFNKSFTRRQTLTVAGQASEA